MHGLWLQRAMNRLAGKDCIDTELFVVILQQKNNLDPNPDTSYYLGIIKDKEGKSEEAFNYYTQAIISLMIIKKLKFYLR